MGVLGIRLRFQGFIYRDHQAGQSASFFCRDRKARARRWPLGHGSKTLHRFCRSSPESVPRCGQGPGFVKSQVSRPEFSQSERLPQQPSGSRHLHASLGGTSEKRHAQSAIVLAISHVSAMSCGRGQSVVSARWPAASDSDAWERS